MTRIILLLPIVVLTLIACSESPPAGSTGQTEIPTPAGAGSQTPHLTIAADGAVWMSWLEAVDPDTQALKAATLRGGRWSDPVTIADGENWFVNWADFPSLFIGQDGAMAAHWLVKRPGGTYAYDVSMSVSRDGGQTWSEPFSPHDDGTATEHGFVSLFATTDGFGAVWLDGRSMAGDSHDANGHGDGGMTLRGAMLDREGRVLRGDLLDELTCDCCQTGAAVTDAGPIVVYRDRTPGEIRDIYFSHFRHGQWTPGRPVTVDGWEIAACPVNGPAIDAAGPDAVVGWFTGAPAPTVRVAFWSDERDGFSGAIDVSTDRPLGRVDTALLEDGSAVVSWLAAAGDDGAEIRYRRIWRDGRQGPVAVLARTEASRMSGFPRMVATDGRLIFAWTVPGDPPLVHTASVPVPGSEIT